MRTAPVPLIAKQGRLLYPCLMNRFSYLSAWRLASVLPHSACRAARCVLWCSALCAFLLLAGCVGGGSSGLSARLGVAEISANPAILDGALIQERSLSNMRLENVTLRNTAFVNVAGRGVVMKNVVFENCRFVYAVFDGATLENVTFRGGLLASDHASATKRTQFVRSSFAKVLFDGTRLEHAIFNGVGGGKAAITLRGVHATGDATAMLSGRNLRIVVEDSRFQDMTLADVAGDSELDATNCFFERVLFGPTTVVRHVFSARSGAE